VYPDDASEEDECHGWHCHHSVVHVESAILEEPAVWDNLESEHASEAEELAHEAYYDEDDGVAESVAHSVEEGLPWSVLHGECFEASHEDTVVIISPT